MAVPRAASRCNGRKAQAGGRQEDGCQHNKIDSKPLRGRTCTYFTYLCSTTQGPGNNTFYAMCFPFAWPVLSESSRCFQKLVHHVCVKMRIYACTHVRMWQPAHPSANKHKNPCIRTHQKKQQFKDLIPLPSAQQTLPSQEKQIDRRHEMIGEEFDGKKVCSHVSLNKQPFHSRKGSRRHKQILTAQNRKIQRTCAPFHKPKKREATPAEPPFPPVQKQVGWIQGT